VKERKLPICKWKPRLRLQNTTLFYIIVLYHFFQDSNVGKRELDVGRRNQEESGRKSQIGKRVETAVRFLSKMMCDVSPRLETFLYVRFVTAG
jgi:hypothetical protein